MSNPTTPAGGILGHHCTCGHPATDPWHRRVRDPQRLTGTILGHCQMTGCLCRRADPTPKSVVITAYDNTTGHRLAYVIHPGGVVDGLQSCGCAGCRVLWETCPQLPESDPDDLWAAEPKEGT